MASMKTNASARKDLPRLAVVGAAFVLPLITILLFWLFLEDSYKINESTDYIYFYEPVAHNILEGRGFILDRGPAIQYPPGYPVILAALIGTAKFWNINHQSLLSIFILACMALSSFFLFLIARSISSPRTAILTCLIWITYPFTLWLTKQPNSEIPFFLAFYGGFLILWLTVIDQTQNYHRYLICGVIFGLAMLIRPMGIGLGLIGCLIILFVKTEVRARIRIIFAGMMLVGNLLCVLPWEIWVYSKTGKWVLLSSGDTPSVVDGLTFALPDQRSRKLVPVPDDVKQLMERIQMKRIRSTKDIIGVIGEEFLEHPWSTAKLFAIKAARSWYGTDSRRLESEILLVQLPYLLVLIFAASKCWKHGGRPRKLVISTGLVILYFWMMTTLVNSQLRYMTPAIGLSFVILAGVPYSSTAKAGNKVDQTVNVPASA